MVSLGEESGVIATSGPALATLGLECTGNGAAAATVAVSRAPSLVLRGLGSLPLLTMRRRLDSEVRPAEPVALAVDGVMVEVDARRSPSVGRRYAAGSG